MMATIARERPRKISLAPNGFDLLLSAASLVLLGAVLAAIHRGRPEWADVPPLIWAHIGTILIALVLTPLMLLRRRGDRLHRRIGWGWSVAMALSALMTFGIREIREGQFSLVHLLSGFTLLMVVRIVITARRHEHARHRNSVRGTVAGALLIAGLFTFPVERLMGRWLFG